MYAELEVKTNFSFLRGASRPEELIIRAAELGLTAIALNDFDGVYGIPKAYWEKKKYPGLKLISGASLSLEGSSRLTLLARDRKAYGLLCRILTASHAGKEKGKAALTFERLRELLLEFPEAAEGLFALAPLNGDFLRLRSLFPKLYVTLHRHRDGFEKENTAKAVLLRDRWSVPIVATNDVHYHESARQPLQDALTAIRENSTLQQLGHKLFSNGERRLKSPAEMRALFSDLPEALEASLEIADQCTFCPSELKYRYPSEWIPQQHSAQSYLEELTWKGAEARYKGKIPENVTKQLKHEFKLIQKLDFPDYFITIHDIVEFARSQDILCQGRGAAANSAVCYCLGITAIDPVLTNLLFERFISEERKEPPDIDVDFEHERREEVLQYVYKKYGRDRAGMVSAVVTYRKRSAFRELAKALGVDVGTLSAKKLDKVFDARAVNSETKEPRKLVEDLSEEMAGFPRHLSIHSGGFTLSADPLIEIVPIEPARMENRTIIQWDKYDLDFLGLLKVDLLSLGMLTAIQRTLKLIGKELHEVPQEDPETYKMIQLADTVGTFQVESRAQMSMLGRLLPNKFYDLVIQVAIVRPGPIVGKMVHPYLRRRRGEEKEDYPHPALRGILGRTLGVPLFQEQVMKMAVELGGFTPGEADELRRAIAAWRSEGSITKMGQRLKEGFKRSGLSDEFCDRIFQQIQGFAQYGFPESHAASFALIAYVSCWLKCHHPAEFACSLLNSQPMGFYSSHTIVDDAKLHGVTVKPVHLNDSSWESTIVGEARDLQLGWNIVKGLHQQDAERILSLRPFSGLPDFLQRAPIRRDALLRLAMGGTFEAFGYPPREALWQVLELQRKREQLQGDLFLDCANESKARFASLGDYEKIIEEYDAFSLSTHGHPMMALRKILPLPKLNSRTLKQQRSGVQVRVAGLLLVRQRPPTAKGMTFGTLEDEFGFIDIAISPDIWERVKDVFLDNCFLDVSGKLQRETNSFSIWVANVRSVWPERKESQETRLVIEPSQHFHSF
ncbi:MAG: error-prone DNA polymerase [Bdellovibrionota bacterium]